MSLCATPEAANMRLCIVHLHAHAEIRNLGNDASGVSAAALEQDVPGLQNHMTQMEFKDGMGGSIQSVELRC
jgi:hypothetical protein